MNKLLIVSGIFGALALAQSFGLYFIARDMLYDPLAKTQTMMFLRFIVGGHLLLFSTRTRHPFWAKPHPSWQLLTAIIATQVVGVLFVGFGWLMTSITWADIGIIWLYDIAWFLLMDGAKLITYRLMEHRAHHQQRFLGTVNKELRGTGD